MSRRFIVIKGELVCSISFETHFWRGFSAWSNNSSFVKRKLFVHMSAHLMTISCGRCGCGCFGFQSLAINRIACTVCTIPTVGGVQGEENCSSSSIQQWRKACLIYLPWGSFTNRIRCVGLRYRNATQRIWCEQTLTVVKSSDTR